MFRLLCVGLIAGWLAAPASAQDWARARLDKSPRHLEWVKVKAGTREVSSFVAYPEVKDKAPAVVVIHEIFGLTDWVRGMTDQLAEQGYIAIAPDLLSGMGKNGGGTDTLNSKEVGLTIRDLKPAQIDADLDAVVDYVAQLPACNGKVVVCGFCWGGGQTFRYANHNAKLKAAFPFYGPGPTTEDGVKNIACPVYGFYGGNDMRVNATIPKAEALMKAAGKTYEPVVYEEGRHGFMRAGEDPSGNAGNKKAREEAWKRFKELLKKV